MSDARRPMTLSHRPSGTVEESAMPWFRCLIRGENFPRALAEGTALLGFYTTRFVEADDAEDAEARVLESLHGEPRLAPPPGHQPDGNARVFFESIDEILSESVPAELPGFAWHRM
jgi:hypothetical protein